MEPVFELSWYVEHNIEVRFSQLSGQFLTELCLFLSAELYINTLKVWVRCRKHFDDIIISNFRLFNSYLIPEKIQCCGEEFLISCLTVSIVDIISTDGAKPRIVLALLTIVSMVARSDRFGCF